VLLNTMEFNWNPQGAIERPRFQSEHYVESFDNHSMRPGVLYLDERLPAAVVEALKARGHKIEIKQRTDSGSAPVIIRMFPSGAIEAGSDPYYYRFAQAW
jgi:gamma-glutamyltranspeptidase/glutathione hydrolase